MEDDEEVVPSIPSKQMKITTTDSFLHNAVRVSLSIAYSFTLPPPQAHDVLLNTDVLGAYT